MRNVRISALLAQLLALVIAVPSPAAVLRAVPQCGGWMVVKSADGRSNNNHLYGVAGTTPADIWAVGSFEHGSGAFETLTEHWDGKAWSAVPSLDVGSGDNALGGVAAVSSSDVWAVGSANATLTSRPRTLVEHWNGSAWSIVQSPSPGQLSGLGSIVAVSSGDIWAAGAYYNAAGNRQTLIERWNGKKWKIVPSPSPGLASNGIGALSIVSKNDVWAVGGQSSDSNSFQTLTEHWDGTAWSVVPSPSPADYENVLEAVAARSASDVWAVGATESSSGGFTLRTLAEHWDGHGWSVVTTPDVGSGGNDLSGVAVGAGRDVWGVGYYVVPSQEIFRTLIERWDGKQWSVASSPNPSNRFDQLGSVTSISNTLWSVGWFGNANAAHTLVESRC